MSNKRVCPGCGSTNLFSTDMGYVGLNLNDVSCISHDGCGWKGKAWEAELEALRKEIDPETLEVLQGAVLDNPRCAYFAYQNSLLEPGNPRMGHLKFLLVGPGYTYQEPPQRLPDTMSETNWAYQLTLPKPVVTGKKWEEQ